jgi:hypothetical protein
MSSIVEVEGNRESSPKGISLLLRDSFLEHGDHSNGTEDESTGARSDLVGRASIACHRCRCNCGRARGDGGAVEGGGDGDGLDGCRAGSWYRDN